MSSISAPRRAIEGILPYLGRVSLEVHPLLSWWAVASPSVLRVDPEAERWLRSHEANVSGLGDLAADGRMAS